jgi:hypothetical protein
MANSAFTHNPSITVPGSSTDNAVIRWDGTGGKTYLNSGVIIDDSNVITGITSLTVDNLNINGNTIISTDSNGSITLTPNGSGSVVISKVDINSGDITGVTISGGLTWSAAQNFNSQNLTNVDIDSGTIDGATIGASSASTVVATTIQLTSGSPSDGKVLTATDSNGNTAWETAAGGGTSVAGTTDNGILTFVNSGSTFAAEANLRFDGTDLTLKSTGKLHFGDGTDTYTSQIADDQLATWVGGRHMFQMRAGGVFFGWDTGNNTDTTYATQFTAQALPNEPSGAGLGGVHIHQGTSDDAVLQFSSSDVGHGITTWVNTAIYGLFKKNNPTAGGVYFQTYSGSNTADCYYHLAAVTEDNQTKSTSGRAAITFDVRKKSGTTLGAMATNSNIVKISTEDTTRFLFDKEGSGHADVEWTTYSDGRLKSNQVVVPYGLAEVMQLQPKIYDRDSGYIDEITGEVVLEGNVKRQIGFVAQEVKTIIPEVVKDVDALSLYSLDDGKLMAVVVKAIQELNAKVDALQG